MLGANPTRPVDLGDGLSLIVQGGPWATIQGEGPHAGLPATFIRLWGCHLKCFFCDTDFESHPCTHTIRELLEEVTRLKQNLVVLTGGEPMRQNLVQLITELQADGRRVQIETSGSFWFDNFDIETERMLIPDIVVSPKTPRVHALIEKYAVGWKYIISTRQKQANVDGLPMSATQLSTRDRPLARPPQSIRNEQIYLQPMDEGLATQNALNLERCVELAQQHGYRVSLQQHKIIGVD